MTFIYVNCVSFILLNSLIISKVLSVFSVYSLDFLRIKLCHLQTNTPLTLRQVSIEPREQPKVIDNFVFSSFSQHFFCTMGVKQLLNSLYTPVLLNDLIAQRNSSLLFFLDVDRLLYILIVTFCQRI